MTTGQVPLSQVVGPGDTIRCVPEAGTLKLGPGLSVHADKIVSSVGGCLKQSRTGQLYLECRQKRYMPIKGDKVIGIVTDRHSENFVVDIGGPFNAILPQLSFEGATRRNRPNLQSGDMVYARVDTAHHDADPVLACVDALGRSTGMGPLKDGVVVNVTTSHARALLSSPPAPVLAALGAHFPFEVVVGQNGRVWVCAGTCPTTVVVANAIRETEYRSAVQVQALVSALAARVK